MKYLGTAFEMQKHDRKDMRVLINKTVQNVNFTDYQTVSLNNIWMSSFFMEQIKHSFHSFSLLVPRCQLSDKHPNSK